MRALSVVIPALNEYENIARVLEAVPTERLTAEGWRTEVIVVDNGSTDGTGDLARALGATVVDQPVRGYGNAYKAGFEAARGDVVATADADLTYPLDTLPELLGVFRLANAEFMTTDRLQPYNRGAMLPSHMVANHALSLFSRQLFGTPFRDSQSGMWLFRRYVWDVLDVRSGGMGFSQEIKHAAFHAGLRCHETPIEYRPRGGQVKLNAVRDGVRNVRELVGHRRRIRAVGARRTVDLESSRVPETLVLPVIPEPAAPMERPRDHETTRSA